MTSAEPSPLPFRKAALVGLGLMGGSLARDLHALAEPPRVAAWSLHPEDLEEAAGLGIVHEAPRTVDEVVVDADLVVYATPLGSVVHLLERHHRLWRTGAVVTDVASLKEPVVAEARRLGAGDRFVGSHPMAGGEQSGFGASRTGLFRGARVWITDDTGSAEALARTESFWRAVGAEPVRTRAAEHDHAMIWASHLPQLVSNALARAMADAGLTPAELGPGGRDMTRLAGSSPWLWRDLLQWAGAEEARALRRVTRELGALARHLEHGRIEPVTRLMERTRAWREEGAS